MYKITTAPYSFKTFNYFLRIIIMSAVSTLVEGLYSIVFQKQRNKQNYQPFD